MTGVAASRRRTLHWCRMAALRTRVLSSWPSPQRSQMFSSFPITRPISRMETSIWLARSHCRLRNPDALTSNACHHPGQRGCLRRQRTRPTEPPLTPASRRSLWMVCGSGSKQQGMVPIPEPCLPVPAVIELRGGFDRVVIRHCTLDPGGEQAQLRSGQCQAIPYVQLVVVVTSRNSSSKPRLWVPSASVRPPMIQVTIQKLNIRDSIVHSIDPESSSGHRDRARPGRHAARTVFGNVTVNRLFTSEALIQGLVRVTDTQHGCFRFSATNEDPQKRLPPQFESHPIDANDSQSLLLSRAALAILAMPNSARPPRPTLSVALKTALKSVHSAACSIRSSSMTSRRR